MLEPEFAADAVDPQKPSGFKKLFSHKKHPEKINAEKLKKIRVKKTPGEYTVGKNAFNGEER